MADNRIRVSGKKFSALRGVVPQERWAANVGLTLANVKRISQSIVTGVTYDTVETLAKGLNFNIEELIRVLAPTPGEEERAEQALAAKARGEPAVRVTVRDMQRRVDAVEGTRATPRGDGRSSLKPLDKAAFIAAQPAYDVPLFPSVTAAGTDMRPEDSIGSYPVPGGHGRMFAVRIDGQCMEPLYRDGNVIVCDWGRWADNNHMLVDGKPYWFRLANGETGFKRVKLDGKAHVLLKPDNPDHKPVRHRLAEVQSAALVVRVCGEAI